MLKNKEKIYDEKEIIAHFSTDNGIIMPDHKVTGSAEKPAPILIPAAAPITFCSPRRPRSRRYSRRNSERGTHRWGSVTMGACKGSYPVYYLL